MRGGRKWRTVDPTLHPPPRRPVPPYVLTSIDRISRLLEKAMNGEIPWPPPAHCVNCDNPSPQIICDYCLNDIWERFLGIRR